MENKRWLDRFPKNIKPAYEELLAFMPDETRALFLKFNDEMNNKYRVFNKWHRYINSYGWVYGYCRNYRCELLYVSINDGSFRVLGIDIKDAESLSLAFEKAKDAYDNGYEDRYAKLTAEKRNNQAQKSKLRLEREKVELEKLKESIDPDKFNRFRWTPKVSRAKLIRLYAGEAKGLLDEALLDDIGYTFYERCRQAGMIRELMEKGRILCHHCHEILQSKSYTGIISCSCGYLYTYREYRRSCNAANMPGGRAAPIFKSFADKWPACKSSREKMLLVDWLVHECHVTVMSGEKGRSVCVNLIEGTIPQLREMLEMLAGH